MKTKFEYSAGGVVLWENKVLVITTTNLKNEVVNTFPKGHIEQGETQQVAAIREVEEETGLKTQIVDKLRDVEYWFVFNNERIHKKVSWYLMKPISESSANNLSPDREDEKVQNVQWVSIDEVEKILSYKSDKELIKLLKDKLSINTKQ